MYLLFKEVFADRCTDHDIIEMYLKSQNSVNGLVNK